MNLTTILQFLFPPILCYNQPKSLPTRGIILEEYRGDSMNTEHKQSINLTSYAESILKEDLELFAPDQTATGFLNDIIERYCDIADASIHTAIVRQRARLSHALDQDLSLSAELTDGQKESVIRLLDSETEYRLMDKGPLYESGRTFTFRLKNRNYEHFFNDGSLDWPDADYYNGYFSRYLKAVVEEYCRLPLFRREEIYFYELIETIETAIASARMIRVEMFSPLTGQETWDVRPFRIQPNASHLYHYLIGKSVEAGGLRKDEKIASIRLCRIRKLTVLNKKTSRSGMLSAAEKKEIRQKISSNTVDFLIGEEEEIIVRLSKIGEQKYRNTLFLRPVLHQIDESGCHHFYCTRMQARQYFIRFGAEAEIISPTGLRKEFADMYRKALDLYQ